MYWLQAAAAEEPAWFDSTNTAVVNFRWRGRADTKGGSVINQKKLHVPELVSLD